MTEQPGGGPGEPSSSPDPEPRAQLRRSRRNKVLAGVCGGLGRYFDIDPVIFRIVLGVLTVTGGAGLIFYGFAWLLIAHDGEEENEARRLLTGRVEGPALVAVLMALVGCGLFLSMLGNGGVLMFATLLTLAMAGSAYWSQRRRLAVTEPRRVTDPAVAHAVADAAPPETQAPPAPGGPSWWRNPIVKDGTTGPVGTGYLWGPDDTPTEAAVPLRRRSGTAGAPWAASPAPEPVRPRSGGIGGRVFLLALAAAGLGTGLTWNAHPLGASLQAGFACALAVFGLGIAVSAFRGRTGFGSVMLAVITAGLLAGAAVLPRDISTDWVREEWRPASVAAVQPRYELGSGIGTLDLSAVAVPKGETLSVAAEVGAGQLRVVVPKNATVEVRVQVGLGDIQLAGEAPADVDVAPERKTKTTLAPPEGTAPGGTLELDLKAAVGQVEVTRATS
ncbi:PspC domain-containing protein [Streptomyces sp. A3M-1-3]|uniref:PspC domain-containing protein n=1 Tax=Streptomyces sp. A3M-1-3 TaxID=2962044 RepID=UPI0020B83369|nr:PspC domain-containing protein [Streptomyces sp. A3M-1-3]MCP3819971.1 PspC domain-containing protein [Streptomyces sp. A3M-1-3]